MESVKIYRTTKYKRGNKLKQGHLYMFKNGKVNLYLGRMYDSGYLFYLFDAFPLINYKEFILGRNKLSYDDRLFGILDYDYHSERIKDRASSFLKGNEIDVERLHVVFSPKVYEDLGFFDEFNDWYITNKMFGNISNINEDLTLNPPVKVKTKDLIEGKIYASGFDRFTIPTHLNFYCYCGRDKDKNYIWLNVKGFMHKGLVKDKNDNYINVLLYNELKSADPLHMKRWYISFTKQIKDIYEYDYKGQIINFDDLKIGKYIKRLKGEI